MAPVRIATIPMPTSIIAGLRHLFRRSHARSYLSLGRAIGCSVNFKWVLRPVGAVADLGGCNVWTATGALNSRDARSRSFRVGVLSAVAALFVAAGGPEAQAAAVSVQGSTLTYRAAAGEVNSVRINPFPELGETWVYEQGLTPGPGCEYYSPGVPDNIVRCSFATVWQVDTGDMDDVPVTYGGEAKLSLQLGPGNDSARIADVNGPTSDDVVDGGPGNDDLDLGDATALGGDGADKLYGRSSHADGGPGNDDILLGGNGVGVGGPGNDTLRESFPTEGNPKFYGGRGTTW